MSMSGGGQSSSQTSKPLAPEEMQGYYDQAMKNLTVPTVTPVQQQTLTGGDYAALQQGYEAPIQRQQDLALKQNNQDMADRGIYTSLNAVRSNDNTRETYAPQFAAADAKALEMKAAEQTQGNQIAAANEQAKWRPADYLQSLWTGSKGQTTDSSSMGVNGGFYMSLAAAQALMPSAAGAGGAAAGASGAAAGAGGAAAGASGAAAAPSAIDTMGAMSKDLQAQQAKSQPAPLPSMPMAQMPTADAQQPYRPYRSGGYGV